MNRHAASSSGRAAVQPDVAGVHSPTPTRYYHRLRETDPVHRSPLGFFVASRHADVSPHPARQALRQGLRRPHDAALRQRRSWRSRSIAACATGCCSRTRPTTRACAAWWSRPSRRAASRTCARASRRSSMPRSTASTPQGHMDLIADFAYRLPVTVICDMLGIPEEEHELFFHGRAHRRPPARSRAALARRDRRGQRRQPGAGRVFPRAVRAAPPRARRRPDERSWCRPRRRATSSPTRS